MKIYLDIFFLINFQRERQLLFQSFIHKKTSVCLRDWSIYVPFYQAFFRLTRKTAPEQGSAHSALFSICRKNTAQALAGTGFLPGNPARNGFFCRKNCGLLKKILSAQGRKTGTGNKNQRLKH